MIPGETGRDGLEQARRNPDHVSIRT